MSLFERMKDESRPTFPVRISYDSQGIAGIWSDQLTAKGIEHSMIFDNVDVLFWGKATIHFYSEADREAYLAPSRQPRT